MPDSPPCCTVDASVLIDLHHGGLLTQALRLPYRLSAPDVVIEELTEPDGSAWVEPGLEKASFSGDQVFEVLQLRVQSGQVSTPDLFALVLARSTKATLLTGDRVLRQIAEREGIPVRGTLWVLDELVRWGIIDQRKALRALEKMLAHGNRLPENECQRRMRRWRA